ncbi:TBC1 domain family member 15, partial [Neolamprologus brichardi]|uniref:TBC1 domain family member 15 n=1 Tax=Neolamprologus brichardi TaxID=32507 RepID=UPI001643C036
CDSAPQVIFEHEGVFLHPSSDEEIEPDFLVSGTLRILEKDAEIVVEYRPLEDGVDPSNMLCAGKVCSLNSSHERSRLAFAVSVSDLRSVTVREEGWTFIVLQLKDSSTSLPHLHFHQGGSRAFLDSLRRFALLTECPSDHTCLLVSTPNKALSQSFENLLDDNNFGLVHKFKRDPYVTTLGGFSKVTNYLFDALRGMEEQQQRPCLLSEKDVNRTDRTNRFYEGIDNPGLVLLHDILMTYCMYDFDLGYVQGMSDLLSPILYVMENEVEAFWCFVAFMDQMHENFEEQMQGMKTQLIQLSSLLRLLDLAFWNYLESQDSGYLYFCFRWLLIRFKRELSFVDVLRLWEVMWTGLPCENFHLLVCCAILDSEKQKIMEENYGFNEILKHINELSMKLDVEEILQKAEGICLQIRSCKDLPRPVATTLGFDVESRRAGSTDCGSAATSGAARREVGVSNGHSRESSCEQSGRGAFVS